MNQVAQRLEIILPCISSSLQSFEIILFQASVWFFQMQKTAGKQAIFSKIKLAFFAAPPINQVPLEKKMRIDDHIARVPSRI